MRYWHEAKALAQTSRAFSENGADDLCNEAQWELVYAVERVARWLRTLRVSTQYSDDMGISPCWSSDNIALAACRRKQTEIICRKDAFLVEYCSFDKNKICF
jgi:hypothetical protein